MAKEQREDHGGPGLIVCQNTKRVTWDIQNVGWSDGLVRAIDGYVELDLSDALRDQRAAEVFHLANMIDCSIEPSDICAHELSPHLYLREESRALSCPPYYVLLLKQTSSCRS